MCGFRNISSNKSRVLTGAVALTSDNNLHPDKVSRLSQNTDVSGIQWLSFLLFQCVVDFNFLH
jgi:hypothetical protein